MSWGEDERHEIEYRECYCCRERTRGSWSSGILKSKQVWTCTMCDWFSPEEILEFRDAGKSLEYIRLKQNEKVKEAEQTNFDKRATEYGERIAIHTLGKITYLTVLEFIKKYMP